MQPLAGSGPFPQPHLDLPHSRPRPRPMHWLATAAALAAVIAGAAIVQPSDAKATAVDSEPRTLAAPRDGGPSLLAPDPRAADFPMDCGPASPDVVNRASGDLDGDGRMETVAVVRCHSETGTPPSGIYVLGQPEGKGGKPPVVATFLDPGEKMSVQGFGLRGKRVSATLLGYSSDEIPRCCPDLQREVNWRWQDGKFVLKALPVPGSV